MVGIGTYQRVDVTEAAGDLLRPLTEQYGPLMFHQSGGCCDGSAPMCYPVGMFLTGPSDVKLGELEVRGLDPIEVFISEAQFEYWKYTHITIDVVPGRGAGFSVEGPTGNRFIIRSRMLNDAELEYFGLAPKPAAPPR
ncbi:DUF779 domain-containing protein [Microbacterium caowuchunii]|uniref:DUF779 domain-containing protein n=1 Tax=Microbacterium caowuchunii TaxID=2614638 RepID=A0A5J6KX37_9MICO|nr:DUF779 domain-containing protein [Microbacterium caowuchunii]KAA9134469.1 DUF779 domain-containing protein [Microbacterium caowuchunii]QEW01322.1 DUF779 domain-containing protein [Microbacterium caowuchunii]